MVYFKYPLQEEEKEQKSPSGLLPVPAYQRGITQPTEPPSMPNQASQTNLPPGTMGYDPNYKEEIPMDQIQFPEGTIGFDPNFEVRQRQATKSKYGSLIRPTLQGAMTAGGAIAGAPLGPVGSVAGAGLMYAASNQLADIFEYALGMRENESVWLQTKKAFEDVPVGAAWEAGGQTLGPILGGVWRGAKWTGSKFSRIPLIKQILDPLRPGKKAGDVFVAALEGNRYVVADNIEDATRLEESIPGLKFTAAQAGRSRGMRQLEQKIARESPELKNQIDILKEQNTQAVTEYLDKFRGVESTIPARQTLETQKGNLEVGLDLAAGHLKRETDILREGDDLVTAGQKIRKIRAGREKAIKRIGSRKFEELENAEIIGFKLRQDFKDILQRTSEFEILQPNVPKILLNAYRVLTKNKWRTSAKSLQQLRSELGSQLEDMRTATKRNSNAERRLSQMLKAIDQTLDEAPGVAEEILPKLKEARRYWKQEYVNKFKKGPALTIARQTAAGPRVADADVVSQFFRKGPGGRPAAKQYKEMTGYGPGSKKVMKKAVQQSFVGEVYDAAKEQVSPSKMADWLRRHRPALKELGLEDEFDNVWKARQQLDEGLELKAEFDKSLAAKVLDADPGREIGVILSGSNKKEKMVQLMNRLKGNERAINGIQNVLVEQLRKIAPENVKAINNFMKEYADVYKVAFRNAPKKLSAMRNYQNALSRIHQGKVLDLKDDDKILKMFQLYVRVGISKFRTVTTLGNVLEAFKSIPRKNRLDLLSEALVDPNITSRLAWYASRPKGMYSKKELMRRMVELSSPAAEETFAKTGEFIEEQISGEE